MNSKRMPTYKWLKGSVEGLPGDDIAKQYAQYCRENNLPVFENPFVEENKFVYTPPPEQRSLAAMSQNSCGIPSIQGSARRLPNVPLETPWHSVDSHIPTPAPTPVPGPGPIVPPVPPEYISGKAQHRGELISGRAPGRDDFVSGQGFVPNTGGADLYSQRILSEAQERTLPNTFQVTAGTWEFQRPSLMKNSGPPFSGLFNVLSQTQDANIGLQDLMPELQDPRYLPYDEELPTESRMGDMISQPDQLAAASNRYTHLVGVSQDPVTGGFIVEYGQDFSKDYEGKVYDTPPAMTLGAPNPWLDILTNFGGRPNQRGAMIVKQNLTNQVSPASNVINQAYLNNASRDQMMQLGARQMVNAPRSENVAPIDSKINAANPNNYWAPWGNGGLRAAMQSNARLLNPDVLAPIPYETATTAAAKHAASPLTLAANRERNAFFREGETQDVLALGTHNFPHQTFTPPQAQIDGAGFSPVDQFAPSTPVAQMAAAAPHVGVDGRGFTQTSEAFTQQRYDVPSLKSNLAVGVDGQGYTQTSFSQAPMPITHQGSQQTDSVGVDGGGLLSVSRFLSQSHKVPSLSPQISVGVDGRGFTQTSDILSRYNVHMDAVPQNHAPAIQGQGFTQTQEAQFYRHANPMTAQLPPQIGVAGDGLQQTERAFTMARHDEPRLTTHAQVGVDGRGFTQTASAMETPTFQMDRHMPQTHNVGVSAQGFSNYADVQQTTSGAALKTLPQTGVSGQGLADYSYVTGYGHTFDGTFRAGAENSQAQRETDVGIKPFQTAVEGPQVTHTETYLDVLRAVGPAQYKTPDVKDPTQQSLLPLALDMNKYVGENYGLGDAMRAEKKIAQSQAGSLAFLHALQQQKNQDLARLGLVNLAQSSDASSSRGDELKAF